MSTNAALRATYAQASGRTFLQAVREEGGLRLRHPRSPSCEGTIINTAGGIVAGDYLSIDVALGENADVVLTTVAAEKVYGSEGATSSVATRLALARGAHLVWLPHETIVFGGARLERRVDVALGSEAMFVAVDIVVFGRSASGETNPSGLFRDTWRLRRNDKLVFAEDARIEGAIGDHLDRPAIAAGARTCGVLLITPPELAAVDRLRAAAMRFENADAALHVEVGVTRRDDIVFARLLARSPERLKAAVSTCLACVDGLRMPRHWL